jgi:hypothetical protein
MTDAAVSQREAAQKRSIHTLEAAEYPDDQGVGGARLAT